MTAEVWRQIVACFIVGSFAAYLVIGWLLLRAIYHQKAMIIDFIRIVQGYEAITASQAKEAATSSRDAASAIKELVTTYKTFLRRVHPEVELPGEARPPAGGGRS